MPYANPEDAKRNRRERYARTKADPKKLAKKRAAERLRYEAMSDEERKKRAKQAAEWKKANPEKVKATQRRTNLKRFYGITPEDYKTMLEKQGNVCAICGTADPISKRFHVDHSHTTGEVRGLLCANCNHGLGKFQDSPENLMRAAKYLAGFMRPPDFQAV